MKIIEGQNNYVIRMDELGNPIEGVFADEQTSVITGDDTAKSTDLTTDQVDWCLNHAAENGINSDILQLEIQPRSSASDAAVAKLISDGITIITVAP